ncbi:hypothetical protein Tco_0058486 [Tanacetum coccineum]
MKCVWLPESIGTLLDPPWSDLELHLSGDEDLRDQGARVVTKKGLEALGAIRTGFLGHSLRKSGLGPETTKTPRGNNFNQGQIYRPPVHQPVVNQPVAHQGPAPQTHGVSKTDFERYVTANDAVLRNMQNQGQNLQSQMANLTDMLSKFVTANTASTSGSGTLPGPKRNHDIEVTKDKMPPANNGSTEDVQPPVVQIQTRDPNPEPNVAPVVTPIPKASIPFPSRRNDEKAPRKIQLTINRREIL